jgi:hypothetical protein
MTDPAGKESSETKTPLETPALILHAIEMRTVSWQLLLGISMLSKLEGPENAALRKVGRRHLPAATDIYKEKWGGEVGLFPPVGGVYIHGDGEFHWSFYQSRIHFDWSEAWPLTYQIEVLAEEAREWWPEKRVTSTATGEVGAFSKLKRLIKKIAGDSGSSSDSAVDRRPHSMRAFGLATWVMGALRQENARPTADTTASPPPPSAAFKSDMLKYRTELAAAEDRFQAAAQRTAQSRYWHGAVIGTCILAVICALLGAVFWGRGTSAAYGVALPAGGLGAIVSLLQRMSSGKLILDIDASRDLLEVFGAVRPFIGAVFGLAVMALLIGGLVPAIHVPTGHELAFFAGVGFLAGFNERWAQDMLKSSSDQLGPSQPAAGSVGIPGSEASMPPPQAS